MRNDAEARVIMHLDEAEQFKAETATWGNPVWIERVIVAFGEDEFIDINAMGREMVKDGSRVRKNSGDYHYGQLTPEQQERFTQAALRAFDGLATEHLNP